jgi:uncharacterized protein (DUF4415 family)
MPVRKATQDDARERARELLEAVTDEDDREISGAALGDADVLPLDEARLARMRPVSAREAADIQRRMRGRPRMVAPKDLVSLRLDSDVVERFRATGPGWQTLINEVLREHLSKIPG